MKCDVLEYEKEGTAKAAGPMLWWLCDEHRPTSTVDDYSWNAALEAAAKACATYRPEDMEYEEARAARAAAGDIETAIRSLKRGQSSASTRPPCDSCHEQPRGVGLSVCESCAKSIYGRKVSP